jgi:glyoxylase-like metal-dependent hydrolase (beta-lactamase superfamily II)
MMGIPKRDVDRLFRNYINLLRRFSVHLEDLQTVSDGAVIESGLFSFTVHATPGHTEGSICLSCDVGDNKTVLFSGDHIIEGLTSNSLPEVTFESEVGVIPYLESLTKIARLDISAIFPGHGDPIFHPGRFVSDIVSYHRRLSEDILKNMDAGWVSPVDLCGRIFPGRLGVDSYVAVFEIYSHLLSLKETGAVRLKEEDDRFFFSRG